MKKNYNKRKYTEKCVLCGIERLLYFPTKTGRCRKCLNLGKKHSETTKKNKSIFFKEYFSTHLTWNQGKNLSEEHRQKISIGVKGKRKGISNFNLRGENNGLWLGDKVRYQGLHDWVRRELGKPNKCEHCKTMTAKAFHWANNSHEYKRDLNDWKRLCQSCHWKYDKEVWGQAKKYINA